MSGPRSRGASWLLLAVTLVEFLIVVEVLIIVVVARGHRAHDLRRIGRLEASVACLRRPAQDPLAGASIRQVGGVLKLVIPKQKVRVCP